MFFFYTETVGKHWFFVNTLSSIIVFIVFVQMMYYLGDRAGKDAPANALRAFSEGALFGLANQLLGTLTALMLIVLATSGVILWWRRRPSGLLGAPKAAPRPTIGLGIAVSIVVLALYMPMFSIISKMGAAGSSGAG